MVLELPTTFTTKHGDVLHINLARQDELQEICDFVDPHFFGTSPIKNVFKTNPLDEDSMRDSINDSLKDPISLTVRDATGRLVGVRLNQMEERLVPHATLDLSDKYLLIMSLLDDLEKGFDLFTMYNTDKVMFLFMLAVDEQYGRLGIGSVLISMSLELATKHGAGAVKVLAFSSHAAKAAAKVGMETLRTIDYVTYELNGVKVLAHETEMLANHTAVKYMARSLP